MLFNSKSKMIFRMYRPEDHDAVVEIFQKQNIQPPVNLPMPEEDSATLFVIVGEQDGVVRRALLLRGTLEAHYVTAPDDTSADDLRRMMHIAEGAVLQINNQLENVNRLWRKAGVKARLPLFRDVFARVPWAMPKMIEFMKRKLRFIEELPDFVSLWKAIGH